MPQTTGGYVLDGRVVTMNATFEVLDHGRVYVRDGRIVAVAPADAPPPEGFDDAPLVKTAGTVYPGLIELHNHLPYDVLPLWQVTRRYSNRGQWGGANPGYRARVSGPMGVLGRVGGYIEAVARYVEVKCLLGGVTTSQGIALYSNAGARRYYRGLVRNVEQPASDDLPAAGTRIADVEAQNASGFLQRLERSSCLLLHLSEGLDEVARKHFRALRLDARSWAITDALAGIHCAGLRGRDFATLRSRGGSMVWSPLSNFLLYGATADIARAVSEHVVIALGSDWSPSGSKNLLGEMKVAWVVAGHQRADLTARDIVAMATTNPARILKWDHALGSIEAGKRADLVVVSGRGGEPYEHLIRAQETAVSLVVIDGQARYGRPRLMKQLGGARPDGLAAEELTVGTSRRLLDLADAASDPIVGAIGLGEARERLADGLARLPELAARMQQRGPQATVLGATSATEDGAWFLELDHEPLPGVSPRPQLPLDGLATGLFPDLFSAAALADILEPMTLDPLTVADDPDFVDRLAAAVNLPAYLTSELPPLYGENPRPPKRPAPTSPVPSARDVDGLGRLVDRLDRSSTELTLAERRVLVDQAMVLLSEAYVHLESKRAMHAVEPIQALRLLRHRLAQPDAAALSDLEFHRQLSRIFASVRDLHTNYLLPSPFREHTAFLPFMVEECFEDSRPRYLVTGIVAGSDHPTFVPGVEVLYWNGVPVQRAVAVNAETQAGGDPAAAFARGLAGLTIRPLVRCLPPDEDWVTVTYRGVDGVERDARFDWLLWEPPEGIGVNPDADATPAQTTALAYDLHTDAVNHARKVLYAPQAYELERAMGAVAHRPVAVHEADLPTTMPTVLRARRVDTAAGTYGHLRIFTFNVEDADAFVDEVARLLRLLPVDGLIVDVRGNGGGLIHAAERLLQLFTPRKVDPSRAQFVSTPLVLQLCERHAPSPHTGFDLSAWVDSLRQAVTTGAAYSQSRPITDPDSANGVGQVYQGPVVLVTDALCYSATDMFVAGFRDHDVGTILGAADNTGAGGANVWTHELLRALMDSPHPGGRVANPLEPLPRQAGMRVSIRRTLRVGALDGTPLEDLGVRPDVRHYMTADDLLHGNRDLIEHAARVLAAAPSQRLDFRATRAGDEVELSVLARNIDRVDVWVDGRPVDSFDLADEHAMRRVRVRPATLHPGHVELRGHRDGVLVARRARSLAAAAGEPAPGRGRAPDGESTAGRGSSGRQGARAPAATVAPPAAGNGARPPAGQAKPPVRWAGTVGARLAASEAKTAGDVTPPAPPPRPAGRSPATPRRPARTRVLAVLLAAVGTLVLVVAGFFAVREYDYPYPLLRLQLGQLEVPAGFEVVATHHLPAGTGADGGTAPEGAGPDEAGPDDTGGDGQGPGEGAGLNRFYVSADDLEETCRRAHEALLAWGVDLTRGGPQPQPRSPGDPPNQCVMTGRTTSVLARGGRNTVTLAVMSLDAFAARAQENPPREPLIIENTDRVVIEATLRNR